MLDQPDCLLSCHHSLGRLGRAVGVVYLDFSKAFGAVSHDILIWKLRKCGIDEWMLRWVENWLSSEGCDR